jgi:hypothetical protein
MCGFFVPMVLKMGKWEKAGSIIRTLAIIILVWYVVQWIYLLSLEVGDSGDWSEISVAICISGQLRSFRNCAEYIRQYAVEPYGADVFLCSDSTEPQQDKDDAVKSFQPVAVSWCKWTYDKDIHDCPTDLCRKPSMYMARKILECDRLRRTYERKNNFEYDVVVRIRRDMALYEPIFSDTGIVAEGQVSVAQLRKFTRILMPHSNMGVYPFDDGIQDQFFYGSSHTMTQICEGFFNDLLEPDTCHKPYGEHKWGFNWRVHNESILKEAAQKRGIAIKHFPSSWSIIRGGVNNQIWQTFYGLYMQLSKTFCAKSLK